MASSLAPPQLVAARELGVGVEVDVVVAEAVGDPVPERLGHQREGGQAGDAVEVEGRDGLPPGARGVAAAGHVLIVEQAGGTVGLPLAQQVLDRAGAGVPALEQLQRSNTRQDGGDPPGLCLVAPVQGLRGLLQRFGPLAARPVGRVDGAGDESQPGDEEDREESEGIGKPHGWTAFGPTRWPVSVVSIRYRLFPKE